MTKTIVWDSLSSTSVPGLTIGQVTRQLLGEDRGTFVEVPGRAGSWHFSEKRGRRKITVEMFILADTIAERGDAVEALADWLDVTEEAILTISDNPDRFYRGVLMAPPEIDEWRELAGPFEIEWSVDPYSYDNSISSETWTSDADDTHVWDPSIEMIVYPVIEITPNNGTILEFDLTANSRVLSFTGTIPDDTTIVINSITPMVTTGVNTDTQLTGAYNPANVFLAGFTGEFPELIPGSNSIRLQVLDGTATNITVTVKYRKQYRR